MQHDKQYGIKILLNSFHLNGYIVGLTDSKNNLQNVRDKRPTRLEEL